MLRRAIPRFRRGCPFFDGAVYVADKKSQGKRGDRRFVFHGAISRPCKAGEFRWGYIWFG